MDKAVIYARYSSSSQNEQSIDTQIDICKKFAKSRKLVIVDYYIDKGLTGTNANRPGFQKMIEESYLDKFKYVIVYKLDRFSRDEYDDIYYEKLLNDNGVSRLSATESIPDDYFSSKLIKAVTRLNNEQYSRVLSERVNAGLNKNVEKGLMVGGSVTWGYKMVNKKYQIDENSAEFVRMIFDMYDKGSTNVQIINSLTSKGIYNSNGKEFKFQHIFKLLRNKRYIGTFTYKGEEHKNYIPQIVNEELFNRVQEKLSNSRNIRRNTSKVKYSLTGKIYCGECGEPMSGYSGTGRHGSKFHYYKCKNKQCSKSNEKKEDLENLVFNSTISEVINNKELDLWIDRGIEVYKNQFKNIEFVLKNIQSEITKTKNELDNLMKAIKLGILTETTKSELLYLEEKKKDLEIQYIKNDALKPQAPSHKVIKNWFEHFNIVDPNQEDKDAIIDSLVSKVIKSNNKVEVYFQIGNHHIELDLPQVQGLV
ncbi:MAG: recombinase family protein [Acholeplasmataceae bacterium]